MALASDAIPKLKAWVFRKNCNDVMCIHVYCASIQLVELETHRNPRMMQGTCVEHLMGFNLRCTDIVCEDSGAYESSLTPTMSQTVRAILH